MKRSTRRVIPRDILYVLFEIYVFDLNGHPGSLIRVSKEWLDVARSMSCMWTRINVTTDNHWCSRRFAGMVICRTPVCVDSALKWSKQKPLEIVMAIRRSSTPATHSAKKDIDLFRHVMENYTTRISKLTIDMTPNSCKKAREVGVALTGVFTRPLPFLNFLEIVCLDLGPTLYKELFDFVASSCAELHEISLPRNLFRHLILMGILSSTRNKNLTRVKIQQGERDELPCSLILPLSSTLEYLSIFEDITNSSDLDSPEWNLALPKLTELQLGFTSVDTLSRLHLPLLTNLIITVFLSWDPQVRKTGFILLPSLKYLQVQNTSSQITCIRAPSLESLFFEMSTPHEYNTRRILEEIFVYYDGFLSARDLRIEFSSRRHFFPEVQWTERLKNIESLWIHNGPFSRVYGELFWRPLSLMQEASDGPLLPRLIKLTISGGKLELSLEEVRKVTQIRRLSRYCALLQVDIRVDQCGYLVTSNGDKYDAQRDRGCLFRF